MGKTPLAGVILFLAASFGLWQVATATSVPEFLLADAELVDDGIYAAAVPSTSAAAITRVALVDGASRRHAATLISVELRQ